MAAGVHVIKVEQPIGPSVLTHLENPSRFSQTWRDAFAIRRTVFCDEQNVPLENETDDDDPRSWHFVLYTQEHGKEVRPVGVIRLVPSPHGPHPNGHVIELEEPYIKIGRMAVVKAGRGGGIGKELIDTALTYAQEHADQMGKGWNNLVLAHAQVPVERFYVRNGFMTDPLLGEWDEEGIMHIGMWRHLDLKAV